MCWPSMTQQKYLVITPNMSRDNILSECPAAPNSWLEYTTDELKLEKIAFRVNEF